MSSALFHSWSGALKLVALEDINILLSGGKQRLISNDKLADYKYKMSVSGEVNACEVGI